MSYAFNEHEALLWDGLQAVGMLRRARVSGGEGDFYVDLTRPDVPLLDGDGLSTQWQIEYRHCDAPTLRKGVELWIEEPAHKGVGRKFKVREHPPAEEGGSGYFRTVLLTELEC